MKKVLILTIMALSFQANAQIPTDNLQAYYPFNGNSYDISGNGHNATVFGASLTADRFGNPNAAYAFDGMNDYINSYTTFDFPNRAVSFWAKPNVIAGSAFNSCGAIWQDGNNQNYGVILADFRDGVLQLNAGSYTSYIDSTISANTWVHVVIERAIDSTKYYINGTLAGSGLSGNINSPISPYDYLVIGTDRTRSRRFFNGIIDDIRIYSDVLTECEIWSLYKEGTGEFDLGVSQTDNILIANEAGVIYQWINCNDNTIIYGETNQSFSATENGNYAVIVDNRICSDTSACYAVINVGISENSFANSVHIYPNPTSGKFSIDLGRPYQCVTITITDIIGKLIQSNIYNDSELVNLDIKEAAGVYLLLIRTEDKEAVIRLVKE